jgi:hypothetical protein
MHPYFGSKDECMCSYDRYDSTGFVGLFIVMFVEKLYIVKTFSMIHMRKKALYIFQNEKYNYGSFIKYEI